MARKVRKVRRKAAPKRRHHAAVSPKRVKKAVRLEPVRRTFSNLYETTHLQEPCWQCEMDIGHICYSGIPNAKWGMES